MFIHASREGYSKWDLGSAAPLSAALGSTNSESNLKSGESEAPTDDSSSVKNKDDEIKAEYDTEYEAAGKYVV
jgi:hypothetical protein